MNNTTIIEFKKQKHAGGRPRKIFKQEYCDGVIGHMGQGLSLESYAGVIGISKDTLYEWLKLYPQFTDAVNEGRVKCQLLWEKMGLSGSAGRLKGFNATSWQFNMQNRFKWKMREDVTSDDEKLQVPQVILDTQRK